MTKLKTLLNNQSHYKLWFIGVGFWFVYFVGLVLLAFSSSEHLSFAFQFKATIFHLFFIFIEVIIAFYCFKKLKKEFQKYLLISLKVIFTISLIYFIYHNFSIHTYLFDPETHDSPFDEKLFTCSYNWYGYPSPIFYILKDNCFEYGKYIFDVSSLTLNISFLMIFNHLVLGVHLKIKYLGKLIT